MKKKGVLQRFASASGVVSFILAVATAVWLYIHANNTGMNNPVSASLLASVFFFICVGVILTIIGRADLPSFKMKED